MKVPTAVFNYRSEQVHEEICVAGKCTRKIRRVTIKNGKGIKEVITKGPKGPARRTVKKLTKKEVAAIKGHQYLPALFRRM